MSRQVRYAQRTRVPATRSQAEIETLLERAGAVAVARYTDAGRAAVAFTIGERGYRFVLPLPLPRPTSQANEQLIRQRWRALLLVLKAKIEAARSGITSLEEELLPYAILPGGRTVAEVVLPHIHDMHTGDQLLPLLSGPPS